MSLTGRNGARDSFTIIAPSLNQSIVDVVADLNRQFRSQSKIYGVRATTDFATITLVANGGTTVTIQDTITDAIRLINEDNQLSGKADVDIGGLLGLSERITRATPLGSLAMASSFVSTTSR